MVALGPVSAGANGRFPAAQHVVVGPGRDATVVALRTTFGLLVSRDGARSFRWVCEDAMFYPDALASAQIIDPPIEVSASGRVVFGHPGGVRSLTDGCDIAGHPGADGRNVVDLAADPAGAVIYAAQYDPSTETSTILRGVHPALEFVPAGSPLARTEVFTLDVAPGDPRRLYLSGVAAGLRTPVLFRSEDGGQSWQAAAAGVHLGDEAFVSGVSPVDPGTVFVRINEGFGSSLLRSRDGARGFTVVARSPDPMTGFALSDDGQTVWYGSVNGGLFRSRDGGETFAPVNPLPVLALRFHAGALWVSSDWQATFALGRSVDGAETFAAVLRFEDIEGPVACASPSPGTAACVAVWPRQRRALAPPRLDGGTPRDAVGPEVSLPVDDVGSPAEAGPDAGAPGTPPPGHCGCAAPGPAGRGRGAAFLAGLALLGRRDRRRRPLQPDCS